MAERPLPGSPIGRVLLGRYRIVRELAKGGMGVVYLARAEGAVGFVKPVVVKLVLPEHATDERFRNMFVREAQILANLRHPGIVDVIELNEEDGAYVMVLEYVRGYHLGQWSKYLRLKQRHVPADVAILIMVDVLEALHHAHATAHPDGTSMHIVHRDVSPSNILLDEDGRARLLDFGVARMRGGNAEYMTQVKGFVGKLIYSAPEVFAEGGDATPQSDAYACAVVLHEILLGKNPFRTESHGQTLQRVLNHVPEAVEPIRPDAPKGLDAVLAKALSKAPEARYATAQDFALALRSIQQHGESELRTKLAQMLKGDFGREMSELLGLESLADRDDAWRRLSHRAPDGDGDPMLASELVLSELYGSTVSTGSDASSSVEQPLREPELRHKPSAPPTAGPSAPPTAAGPRRTPNSRGFRASAVPPPPPPSGHGQAHVPTVRIEAPARFDHRTALVVLAALSVGALASYALSARAPSQPTSEVAIVAEQPVSATQLGSVAATHTPLPSPAPPPTADAPKPRARRNGRTADPRALSAAFSAQRARIEACFKAQAVSVEGTATLSLDFHIDAEGHVERATLSPAAIAGTELGRCLTRVGLQTDFPAPGRALSFAIPLSARKRR